MSGPRLDFSWPVDDEGLHELLPPVRMLKPVTAEKPLTAVLSDQRDILVAVHGLSSPNPSLTWAARRALDLDASLILVHAVPSVDAMRPDIDYAAVVAAGRALLQTETVRLAARFPDLRLGTYLHCGDLVHALVGLSNDASLLVIGADRLNTGTGIFTGSVAVQVALRSLAPTLVMPTGHRDSGDRNGVGHGHIVVGVDGSAEAYAAVRVAAAEAYRLGTALRIVAAMRPGTPLSEKVSAETSALLAGLQILYPSLVLSWTVDMLRAPVRALTRHSRDAALLVIGRHGRGPRAGMRVGSVAHTLLLRPPCPTLVISAPQPLTLLAKTGETGETKENATDEKTPSRF